MVKFNSSQRIHNFAWIIEQSRSLEEKAIRQKDSSKIIYCCLELRTALEMLEFLLVLGSVPTPSYDEIISLSQKQNGVDSLNKKIKAITFKNQTFFEVLCNLLNIPGGVFNYSLSQDYKHRLSQYIHTYTMLPENLLFESEFIQKSFELIREVRAFLEKSLNRDDNGYNISVVEYATMPEEDKIILEDWRLDRIDKDIMKNRLWENILERRKIGHK
jgi:hypothetical protein